MIFNLHNRYSKSCRCSNKLKLLSNSKAFLLKTHLITLRDSNSNKNSKSKAREKVSQSISTLKMMKAVQAFLSARLLKAIMRLVQSRLFFHRSRSI